MAKTAWGSYIAILLLSELGIMLFAQTALATVSMRATDTAYVVGVIGLILFVSAYLLWKRSANRPMTTSALLQGIVVGTALALLIHLSATYGDVAFVYFIAAALIVLVALVLYIKKKSAAPV
ncbi:MAG: hypothetical protein LBM39_01870 [Candidatus Methanoplasma sp.]|jgi:lipid-A-disaccharide synthase-like uncharacterized protein|nr:hypothetical protein [Candidatus Methanoplasma sp.]